MFAGEVGVPRLLKLFNKYQIKTTWFIPGNVLKAFFCSTDLPIRPFLLRTVFVDDDEPSRSVGHSLETFPEQMAAVRDAGHEM